MQEEQKRDDMEEPFEGRSESLVNRRCVLSLFLFLAIFSLCASWGAEKPNKESPSAAQPAKTTSAARMDRPLARVPLTNGFTNRRL